MTGIRLKVLRTFYVDAKGMGEKRGQTKRCEKCRKIPIIFGKIVKCSAHSKKNML